MIKKKYNVAVLGCGSRGLCYCELMTKKEDEFEIVALCDVNKKQIDKMHSILGLEKTIDFIEIDEFFKRKRADLLVIATPDRVHVPQAIKALELGYDILLEKPISDCKEELEQLLKAQERTGRTILVCHVLRYGPGYKKCEELLKSGIIGKLYAIDATEKVVYWHWAQAYVRGIGKSLKEGHPAILAKCCHDLDLIQHYAQSECESVSSIGNQFFFNEKNMPEGASDRCLDCKHINTCPYSAKRIYVDMWHENGEEEFIWPYNKVSIVKPLTEENILKGLREGEYGRCAFKCNSDQPDHQMVQMTFKNGVKASLKMLYGWQAGRRIVFYGTLGEIIMDECSDEISIMPFGKEKKVIRINTIVENGHEHGGGDGKLIENLYAMLSGEIQATTSLKESIESHLIGISAEKSRKNGGRVVKVHEENL